MANIARLSRCHFYSAQKIKSNTCEHRKVLSSSSSQSRTLFTPFTVSIQHKHYSFSSIFLYLCYVFACVCVMCVYKYVTGFVSCSVFICELWIELSNVDDKVYIYI